MHGMTVKVRENYLEKLMQKSDPSVDNICPDCFNPVEDFLKREYASALLRVYKRTQEVSEPKEICISCLSIAKNLAKEACKEGRNDGRRILHETEMDASEIDSYLKDVETYGEWEDSKIGMRFCIAWMRRDKEQEQHQERRDY